MGKNARRALTLFLLSALLSAGLLGCSSAWEMPNLVGKPFDGLEAFSATYPELPGVAVEYAYHESLPKGVVISQSPAAGDSEEESILLVVSLGKAPVSVSLQGDFAAAKAALAQKMDAHYGKGNWLIDWRVSYRTAGGAPGGILSWRNVATKDHTISDYCALEVEVRADLAALDLLVGHPMEPVRELLRFSGINTMILAEEAGLPAGAITRILHAEDGVLLYYQP